MQARADMLLELDSDPPIQGDVDDEGSTIYCYIGDIQERLASRRPLRGHYSYSSALKTQSW